MEYNNQSKEIVSQRNHFWQTKVVQLLDSSVHWTIQQAYQLRASQYIKVDLGLTLKKEQTGQAAMVKTLKITSVT